MSYPEQPGNWSDPTWANPTPADPASAPPGVNPASGPPPAYPGSGAGAAPGSPAYPASGGYPGGPQTPVPGTGYSGYPAAGYPAEAYQAYPAYPSYPDNAGAYPGGQPGYPGYPYGPPSAGPNTNGMSIASLVVSLAGAVTMLCYGIGGVMGLVGAILGHVARRQIRQRGEAGEGMALAGVIIGWIVTGLSLVIVALLVWFVIWAAHNSDNPGGSSGFPD